ncbi:hypothetical protein ACO0LV_13160 [Pseudactinotalea sp. Z1739]|uniref:hypothetical protein n=1 Tax=Pseudactinotalea sp. Z1739 TaxID=3413028 RepID=UPI003C7D8FF0
MTTTSRPCDLSRRGFLFGTTAIGLAATGTLLAPGAAAANRHEGLQPVVYDSAALTGASRGSALLDGVVYIASRHNVDDGTIRLGGFDPFTGETVSVDDLDLGSTSGNNMLTADDQYVYIGPAGSSHVWRFDPESRTAQPFAEIGPANTWTYRLRVDGDHLWVGTYPTGRLFRVDRTTGDVVDFGRVGDSQYTTAIAVDEEYVYAATAAPGDMRVYTRDAPGVVAHDLTPYLVDSPVGVLDVAASGGLVYVSCGRFIISMRHDGSERVVRPIAEEDRYIDQLTVTPDGRVLALARLTTNYYEVTDSGLDLLGAPLADTENAGFFAVDDDTVVGATALGHVWSAPIGGEATVTSTVQLGYGYPELVQSMLAHSNGDVWAAGYFAMTVHHPKQRNKGRGNHEQAPHTTTPDFFDVGGEAKSMVETASGTVIAGLYPSTNVVAIDPQTHEVQTFGPIGNDQMRPLAMAYDDARDEVVIATTATHGLFSGALTFVDPDTGEMEVRRDLVPEQNLRNVVISGNYAYVAGDTRAEASDERKLLVASIVEVDLSTRTVTRTFEPTDWEAYEDIHVADGILYAVGRSPNGAWLALDLDSEEIILQGDTGGYGGIDGAGTGVFTWDKFTHSIQQLSSAEGGTEAVLYQDVPNGWYNRPGFGLVDNVHGTWGLYGTDLAWFPLPRN